jgi:DNA-binding SARP family transcriptional activator
VHPDARSRAEFGVLGPLRICFDGTAAPLLATKQRVLAAALILHIGRTLTVEKLTDALWDERPPRNARGAIQALVLRLRHTLTDSMGRPLIRTVPGGYLLDVEEEASDVVRFQRLTRQAERSAAAGQFNEAAGQLGDALQLWRGQPLEDIESDLLQRSEAPLLAEQRLLAAERRVEYEMALGHHRDVISELNALVAAHPLRERYWQLLMLALYQTGWRADALAAYRQARQLFTAELGIEPGEELRDLHEAVLADRPVLREEVGLDRRLGEPLARHAGSGGKNPAARRCRTPAVSWPCGRTARASAWIRQCQLPREVSDFVGRDEACEVMAAELSGSSPAVPIVGLFGMAGVGKSALAVRLAHRLRRQFPDGQLYLRLGKRGQRAHGLNRLLADLMVATGHLRGSIPEGLDQRAAAFRAWLADRKVLMVIDNVAEVAQIRPLLPGTAGCAVILTSRRDVRALTVLDGVRHHVLGVLQPAEALEFLDHALRGRAAADPAAAAELAAWCGYLPLGLRVAAASLAGAPGLELRSYTAKLQGHDRLAGLGAGSGPAAAILGVFGTSYERLDPALRRLLVLLAEQELTASEVAVLLGTRITEATRLLEQLERRSP